MNGGGAAPAGPVHCQDMKRGGRDNEGEPCRLKEGAKLEA